MEKLIEDMKETAAWWLFKSKWSREVSRLDTKVDILVHVEKVQLIAEFFYDYMHSDDLCEISEAIEELSNGQIEKEEVEELFVGALQEAFLR